MHTCPYASPPSVPPCSPPADSGSAAFVSIGGNVLAIVGIMSSFLPSIAHLQTEAWHPLAASLQDLGIELFSSSLMSSSVMAVFAIVALFIAISSFQSAAFGVLYLLDADRQWYQTQQLKVG